MFGMLEGKRKKDRPRTWMKTITGWTGATIPDAYRKAQAMTSWETAGSHHHSALVRGKSIMTTTAMIFLWSVFINPYN